MEPKVNLNFLLISLTLICVYFRTRNYSKRRKPHPRKPTSKVRTTRSNSCRRSTTTPTWWSQCVCGRWARKRKSSKTSKSCSSKTNLWLCLTKSRSSVRSKTKSQMYSIGRKNSDTFSIKSFRSTRAHPTCTRIPVPTSSSLWLTATTRVSLPMGLQVVVKRTRWRARSNPPA